MGGVARVARRATTSTIPLPSAGPAVRTALAVRTIQIAQLAKMGTLKTLGVSACSARP